MTLTDKQIYDLNNMNVAAQNIKLGTTISSVETNISELSGSLLSLSSTEEQYTEISGSLTSLDTGVTEISGSVASIDTGVTGISGSLTSLDTEIIQISGSVTSIEETLSGSGTINATIKNFDEDTAVAGLLGVHNSLAYRVHEIEKHLHSPARWSGKAITPTATHFADTIGVGVLPFVIDAGDNDWGTWVQLAGSDDTPVIPGMAYFDPHLMMVTATERTDLYFIQFGAGENSADIIASENYTETMFIAPTPKAGGPISVQTSRQPAGTNIWARCMIPGVATGTISFYIGIHEYIG